MELKSVVADHKNSITQKNLSASSSSLIIDDEVQEFLSKALKEDIGDGDVTTMATIPPDKKGSARVLVKETGTLCGLPLFAEVYHMIDPEVSIKTRASEGQMVSPGKTVITLDGSIASILTGERVALNILGLMSGVATSTSEHVKAVQHTNVKITDTRKTVPMLRKLQKYAVRTGGGVNHRFGLYDMIMIKDNHIDSMGGIPQSVKAARDKWDHQFKIEVECRTLLEVHEALKSNVDRIMLDNMSVDTILEAIEIINGKCETEASGGVNLHTVSYIAETGVDYISIGALTHSMRCIDFSLMIDSDN